MFTIIDHLELESQFRRIKISSMEIDYLTKI